MLTISGLGLYDVGDIPRKTIAAAGKADKIYYETHTNLYHSTINEIREILGEKVEEVGRRFLEEDSKKLMLEAKTQDILVLVPGDPLAATTHIELILEAKNAGVQTQVIHASSIFTAIAKTGLQLYKFGKATTLPFKTEAKLPTSPYHAVKQNRDSGLHTLILLDVKSDEQRYMSANQGLEVLLELENEIGLGLFRNDTLMAACARLGAPDEIIKFGEIQKLLKTDFASPPHVLIMPGDLHFKEEEALNQYA
ncbi:MAG TPA: diphthine synthase [Candidatus Altiarchaeales archaeon]|nr:diphthine synthase [Candidatus Altiarchaeales archaeon]